MKLEYLRQADQILSKCGRPTLPGGISAVPIPKGFLLNMVSPPSQSVTFTKEITGTDPWILRAISSDQGSRTVTGIRCQIQLPNGRFLFGGNGIDVGQFAWIGSYRWLQDPELRCEPGTKIQVTLTNTLLVGAGCPPVPTAPTAVNFLFEGAYLLFLRGGERVQAPARSVSGVNRYQMGTNQNILSPAWASNEAIDTPPGFVDEFFVYSMLFPATWSVDDSTPPAEVTVRPNPTPFDIQIDPGFEHFYCTRMLFDVQLTGTASAIVRGRIRTGTGYLLNDSYIDLARYLNGAEFAANWKVKGGDSVFIDADVADFSGVGNVSLQVFLEGYRRRKEK